MSRLITAFRTLPFPSQAAVVGVLLLLAFLLISATTGIVSSIKDSRFDKREAEREQQRQQLETEREQAIGRATAAEARAKSLEEQTRVLEVTVEAFGRKAEKIQEAVKDEERKMDEESSVIDSDIDHCQRLARICSRLKNLQYYPKDKPCPECQ